MVGSVIQQAFYVRSKRSGYETLGGYECAYSRRKKIAKSNDKHKECSSVALVIASIVLAATTSGSSQNLGQMLLSRYTEVCMLDTGAEWMSHRHIAVVMMAVLMAAICS